MDLCSQSTQLVEKVFLVFWGMCDGFQNQFPTPEKLEIVKTQWILGFMENGIKEENQITGGLSELRRQEKLIYIPAIGLFLKWCGINSSSNKTFMPKEKAYTLAYDIMRGDIPKDLDKDQLTIITHATKQSDPWFLKNNPRSSTEPVFHRAYEIALKDFIAGNLKPIPKDLENEKINDDEWKTLRKYGVLPQYAHLTSRDSAMEVINKLLEKNNGNLSKKLPYNKSTRLS